MMIKSIAAAVALVAVSAAASAATTDWGQHPNAVGGGNFVNGAGTMVDDFFKFSLSSPASVMSVSVTNDGASGVFDLQNGMLSLYSGVPSTGTLLGSFAFDAVAVSHNWGALAAGNYYYEVTAQVVSTASAGSYQLSSTLAAPVPEPETYALLLVGLAGVGFMASRRKSR